MRERERESKQVREKGGRVRGRVRERVSRRGRGRVSRRGKGGVSR